MSRRALHEARRAGFTILELLVVTILIGVVCVIAFPRFAGAVAAAEMRSAKQEVASYLARARAAGVQVGAQAMFVRNGDAVQVSIDSSGVQTPLVGVDNVFTGHGVRLSSSNAAGVDTIRYDARGFAVGLSGTQTLILTRGSLRDSVCITQLGKIAASGCSL